VVEEPSCEGGGLVLLTGLPAAAHPWWIGLRGMGPHHVETVAIGHTAHNNDSNGLRVAGQRTRRYSFVVLVNRAKAARQQKATF
jgi:hypothetical protein